MPVNVPSGLAQQDCIRKAYERAGRKPEEVDYAELHATGNVSFSCIKMVSLLKPLARRHIGG